MSNGYNGWTNYETWVVNLWYDDAFTDVSEDYRDDVNGLADHIRDTVEEGLPEVKGLASDLLNAAMGEVNWYEIAQGYIDELPELEEDEDETDA
jgi:hypothetical protein